MKRLSRELRRGPGEDEIGTGALIDQNGLCSGHEQIDRVAQNGRGAEGCRRELITQLHRGTRRKRERPATAEVAGNAGLAIDGAVQMAEGRELYLRSESVAGAVNV